MGLLDRFCRFCMIPLDNNRRKNIFDTDNSRLLKAAFECIPLPISAEDRYSNFTCYDCANKLNDIADFQLRSLSAADFFHHFLAKFEGDSSEPKPSPEASMTIEYLEESEIDLVDELSLKLEPRSDEEMVSGQVEDATQGSNVPLGVQEGTSSQPQSTAVKDSQLTFGRTRKNLNYCALCKKDFSSKSALVMHRRAHMAGKPFKCVRCKKRFFRKSALMIHREKPFRCKPFKKVLMAQDKAADDDNSSAREEILSSVVLQKQEQLLKLTEHVFAEVKALRLEFMELKKNCQPSGNVKDVLDRHISNELPINSMEGFETFNEHLVNEQQQFVNFLRGIGGMTLKEAVRLIFARIFTAELAVGFTLLGTHQKARFAGTNVYDAVMVALKQSNYTEREIAKEIGERFRLAPEKLKKKYAKLTTAGTTEK